MALGHCAKYRLASEDLTRCPTGTVGRGQGAALWRFTPSCSSFA
jgi:hypothetical protein